MPLALKPLISALLLASVVGTCTTVQAEMQAMDDSELSEVTGQALINLDALTYGGYEYTRINFGGDAKILTNIDKLRIGQYARSGGGTVSNQPADVAIDNFALGRVDNANNANATIVPFEIRDPYLEFAFKNKGNGVREIAGVRIGFGQARGDLSGDILSLSGVMQGKIYGPASIAVDYCKSQPSCWDNVSLFDKIALGLAGDIPVYAGVELVEAGTGNTTKNGQPINRAEQIGIPAGNSLQTDETGLIAALLPSLSTASGCKAAGLPTCFSLLNYKSIFVGDPTKSLEAGGGAKGIYFSLQRETIPWQDLANGGFKNMQAGGTANFAAYKDAGGNTIYPFMVALYDALRGTPRVDTCVGGSGC